MIARLSRLRVIYLINSDVKLRRFFTHKHIAEPIFRKSTCQDTLFILVMKKILNTEVKLGRPKGYYAINRDD
jgi:hypothetical protein